MRQAGLLHALFDMRCFQFNIQNRAAANGYFYYKLIAYKTSENCRKEQSEIAKPKVSSSSLCCPTNQILQFEKVEPDRYFFTE